jgi:hypothetical protein
VIANTFSVTMPKVTVAKDKKKAKTKSRGEARVS